MSNFSLGDFVSRLEVAYRGHLRSIRVLRVNFILDVLHILYKNGLIRGFFVSMDYVEVFLKYYQNRVVFYKIELVSRPGRKVYWSLDKLSNRYNNNSFSGFYIISTSFGLVTSNDCLLGRHIGGEVLLKVSV